MSGNYSKRSRSRVKTDPATELRNQAVKLHDKGDGHGADWVAAATASFRVAFYCLQHLPDDSPDRAAITRRAHDLAYNLMVGTPDNGAPFTAGAARLERVVFSMDDPALGHDPRRS